MNKVLRGMSQAEVIALVGKRDDVSTQKDRDFSPADMREIWRYGVPATCRSRPWAKSASNTQVALRRCSATDRRRLTSC